MGRGVVFLGVLAALLGLVMAQFSGTFSDRVTVTAQLTDTGDALAAGADVKMRGVVVGRVGSIRRESGRPGALVELRLDPGKAAEVPAAVRARSLPANFFGQAFVDLIPPPTGSGAAIRSGARIPQDTSAETVELQDVFGKLFTVLAAVEPAKLATVLSELARALNGRGEDLGDLVERTDAYLRALRPVLPDLQADITAFARFADTLARTTPSLLDSVDDVLVLARTLLEREAQFLSLLSAGLSLTDTAADLLEPNETRLIRVSGQTREIVGVLGKHPRAFSAGFVDLGEFLGGLALGRGGRVNLDVRAEPGPLPVYSPADCPRYPGLDGPNCAGDGSGAVDYGGVGDVGSVEDKLMFSSIMNALMAGRALSSGDIGILLAGSVLRGSTVAIPAGPS
ncbi:MAG: MCE family protein [Sporichthyaceae bacterium]